MSKRQVKTGQAIAELVERRRRAALRQRARTITAAPAKRAAFMSPVADKLLCVVKRLTSPPDPPGAVGTPVG